jgi:hypothetical protein
MVGILIPLLVTVLASASADKFLALFGKVDDFRQLSPQVRQDHEFTFIRVIYNGRVPAYLKNWYTDYPTGDQNLLQVLRRLTRIDVAPESRALPIRHPDLFNYPMLYSGEGGQMILDSREARVMREYLQRGGFWMIDDFWGTLEWNAFELEIKKILPDLPITDVPPEHPVFHSFYDIKEILQVPNVGYAYCYRNCHTWEEDGYKPLVKGVFDRTGRLLILIHFNTDLMDASEWADDPRYPHRFSAYAYRVFANAVVYAMSH